MTFNFDQGFDKLVQIIMTAFDIGLYENTEIQAET